MTSLAKFYHKSQILYILLYVFYYIVNVSMWPKFDFKDLSGGVVSSSII